MKFIYLIFLLTLAVTSQNVMAGENGIPAGEFLYEIESEYFDLTNSLIPCDKKIVIVDQNGNILREAQTDTDCMGKMPEIFKPLIINCQFLTEIDGSSYYIYN
jgi:hypothetical protein